MQPTTTIPVVLRRLAALLLAAFAAGALAAEPITLRFAHVVAEDTPKGIGAQRFKALAEQRLAGKVTVEVYPNSQLFTDEQIFQALLFGDVELAAPSLAKFRVLTKSLQVFDLPFLFPDVAAVHRFQAGDKGKELLNALDRHGIRGLAYWDNGLRVMSANRPLRLPADAAGLTFRIEDSQVMEVQYEALDAVPLKLSFNRVHDALQTGLADGQENTWSNIWSQKFHQVQSHFTDTRHSYLGYMVITNTRFWQGLPKEMRMALETILAEVTDEVNRVAAEKEQGDRDQVKATGVELIELTPEQRTAWQQALQPVWQRFEAEIGSDVIEAARAAGQP